MTLHPGATLPHLQNTNKIHGLRPDVAPLASSYICHFQSRTLNVTPIRRGSLGVPTIRPLLPACTVRFCI